MAFLIHEREPEFQITERVFAAATENSVLALEVINLLLHERGPEIQFTELVLTRAASNTKLATQVMALLLCQRRHEIQITEPVLVEAVSNKDIAAEITTFLLDEEGLCFQITELVVLMAVRNKKSAIDVMSILLRRRREEISITEHILLAAANHALKDQLMILMFKEMRSNIFITERVFRAAMTERNFPLPIYNHEESIRKLLSFIIQEVPSQIEVTDLVVASVLKQFALGSDDDSFSSLLRARGSEVKLTYRVVVVLGDMWLDQGRIFLGLLLRNQGCAAEIMNYIEQLVVDDWGVGRVQRILDNYGIDVANSTDLFPHTRCKEKICICDSVNAVDEGSSEWETELDSDSSQY